MVNGVEMKEEIYLDEAEEIIIELARVAKKLKDSGFLNMLNILAEEYENLLYSISSDRRVFHAVALVQALLNGLRDADPWKTKPAVEMLTHCVVTSMDPEEVAKAKPIGLMGLIRALRDPDISFGLGILFTVAKNIGGCIRRTMNEQLEILKDLESRDLSRKTPRTSTS